MPISVLHWAIPRQGEEEDFAHPFFLPFAPGLVCSRTLQWLYSSTYADDAKSFRVMHFIVDALGPYLSSATPRRYRALSRSRLIPIS
jgi:hypothetical protein